MKKKRITTLITVFVVVFAIVFARVNIKDEKEKIFDYVLENEQLILNGIDEISQLSHHVNLEFGEAIVGVRNAKINQYVDDVEGICVEIKGLLGSRRCEIDSEVMSTILTGKPVEDIGIDEGIIIFDCGGKGIIPSGQDYDFYYSPNDEPVAVYDGYVVCDPSQMKPAGEGFEYIDEGHDTFYVEKIKDKFYFCEARF